MSLNELAQEIHQTAVDHGWWEKEPSFGETVALCHAELSEALEEYRSKRPALWYECHDPVLKYEMGVCQPECLYSQISDCEGKGHKPEGVAVEMADCLIRILDWFGHTGLDADAIVRTKMAYNKTRPYRHGGKRL